MGLRWCVCVFRKKRKGLIRRPNSTTRFWTATLASLPRRKHKPQLPTLLVSQRYSVYDIQCRGYNFQLVCGAPVSAFNFHIHAVCICTAVHASNKDYYVYKKGTSYAKLTVLLAVIFTSPLPVIGTDSN